MSAQDSSGRGGEVSAGEILALAQELRAELQALTDGELRRQARLATFDQQVAQMEASIRSEVERLRSTGAAVELQTDQLRQTLDGLHGDQGLDSIREQLEQLRGEVARMPTADDQRVLGAVGGLAQQLGALERSLSNLPAPDLQPVQARLDDLRAQVAALPAADLRSVEIALTSLQDRLDATPQADLDPIHIGLAQLRDQIAGLPSTDDQRVLGAVRTLDERVSALDSAIGALAGRDALEGLTALVSDVGQRVDAIVPSDVQPLVERLDQLHARVAAIPARDLRPLHDQLDELQTLVGSIPIPDDTALRSEIAAVRADLASQTPPDLRPLQDQLASLRDEIAAMPVADLGPVHAGLGDLREHLDALPRPDVDALRADIHHLRDQIAAIPGTDLGPLHTRLTDLREQLAALPQPDLTTAEEQLAFLRDRIDAVLPVDLEPLHARLGDLREQLATGVAAIATPDLGPLHSRLTDLREQLAALPQPDDSALRASVAGVAAQLDELRHGIDALPHTEVVDAIADGIVRLGERVEAIPAHDDAELRTELSRLTAELDSLRTTVADRFDALPVVDLQPVHDHLDAVERRVDVTPVDLGPLHSRLTDLREQLAALPQPDLDALRTDLATQLDTLRDQLTTTVTAIPTLDLGPLHSRLTDLREQVAALPQPDLDTLHTALRTDLGIDLGLEIQTIRDQIAAAPPVDLNPVLTRLVALREQLDELPRVDEIALRSSVAGVAEQLDQLRVVIDALPQTEAVHALAEGVVRLGERVDAIPTHDDSELRTEVSHLTAQVDSLGTAIGDRFDALPIVDLQPVIDVVREQVSAVPDPTTQLDRLATSTQSIETDLSVLSAAITAIAQQTTPITDITAGLAEAMAALGTLEALAERGLTEGQEAANDQTLALSRATAAADGIAALVGSLRADIGAAVATAKDETINELDERLIGRLRATEARLDSALEERLRVRLDELEELTRRSTVDNEFVRDALAAVSGHMGRLVPADLAPVEASLDALGERVSALPLPDLGPVAAQLARLSATVTSQSRVPLAGAAELEELSTSLTSAMAKALEHLDRQAELGDKMAAALEAMPSTAEQTTTLYEALDRRHEETTSALVVLTLELAETRALVERRGGRRRRGEDAPALPVHVFQQTLAENMQRELDGMKGHLTLLGDRVERALAAAAAAAPAPVHRPPLRAPDAPSASTPKTPTVAKSSSVSAAAPVTEAIKTPTAEDVDTSVTAEAAPAAAPTVPTPATQTAKPIKAPAAAETKPGATTTPAKPVPAAKKTPAKKATTDKVPPAKKAAATEKAATKKAATKKAESPPAATAEHDAGPDPAS